MARQRAQPTGIQHPGTSLRGRAVRSPSSPLCAGRRCPGMPRRRATATSFRTSKTAATPALGVAPMETSRRAC